jgi:hypothetical protein
MNPNSIQQRNLPCNQNAQKWYLQKAINNVKTAKTVQERIYYKSVINYYYNGKARNLL